MESGEIVFRETPPLRKVLVLIVIRLELIKMTGYGISRHYNLISPCLKQTATLFERDTSTISLNPQFQKEIWSLPNANPQVLLRPRQHPTIGDRPACSWLGRSSQIPELIRMFTKAYTLEAAAYQLLRPGSSQLWSREKKWRVHYEVQELAVGGSCTSVGRMILGSENVFADFGKSDKF